LQVPHTTVEAEGAVFGVELTQTTGAWVLIRVLVEQVVDTGNQLNGVSDLIADLRVFCRNLSRIT